MKSNTATIGKDLTVAFLVNLSMIYTVAADLVPLNGEGWHILSYNNTPRHHVTFNEEQMQIEVKKSASPVIYPLSQPLSLKAFRVKAKISGQLSLQNIPQGDRGADDFRLRVGFVYQGDAKLDDFQIQIAPAWLRQLHALAPTGAGISHVAFFNTWQQDHIAGSQRQHKTSLLWREQFILPLNKRGLIDLEVPLLSEQPVIGIWISSDGDDTHSCFDVLLQKLELIER